MLLNGRDLSLRTTHLLLDGVLPDCSDDPFEDSGVIRSPVLDSEVRSDRAEQELGKHLLEDLVRHVSQVAGTRKELFRELKLGPTVFYRSFRYFVSPYSLFKEYRQVLPSCPPKDLKILGLNPTIHLEMGF